MEKKRIIKNDLKKIILKMSKRLLLLDPKEAGAEKENGDGCPDIHPAR
jgi:hypothetical protein